MLVIPGGPGEDYEPRLHSFNREPKQPYILRVGFAVGVLDFLQENLRNLFNICVTKPPLEQILKEIVNKNVLFKDFKYSGPYRNVYSSHKITSPEFNQSSTRLIYTLSQLAAPIEKKYVLIKANELDKDSLKALLNNNTVFLESSKEDFLALYTELSGSEDRFINLFRV